MSIGEKKYKQIETKPPIYAAEYEDTMPEITLPVIATYPKNGDPIYVYRTFTEKDFEEFIKPFENAFLELQAQGRL